MSSRVVWFVAGTAAGVYASVKARRAAYRVSMPGLIDQAAALGSGMRAFNAEVREGMHAKEHQIRTATMYPPVTDRTTPELPKDPD